MANMTSAQLKAEITTTFYGINPATQMVDRVSLTRGQVLTLWREGRQPSSYRIKRGRPPQAEVLRVFGLVDIVRITAFDDTPPGMPYHPTVAQLHDCATARRAAAVSQERDEQ